MDAINGEDHILRFLYNQDIKDAHKEIPKLRTREIFYQRPHCHKCSVAIEGENSYQEYKKIAKSQNGENRKYVGFAKISARTILELNQNVVPDYSEFKGHAHIIYSNDFVLVEHSPPSNDLDMILRKFNLDAEYLIDQDIDIEEFTNKSYITKEDYPKRLIPNQ